MKLHERESISGFGWRMAVPGGWLYDNGCAAFGFVPDPTAEHVTHGAGGAAAEAIYRNAVRDCIEALGRRPPGAPRNTWFVAADALVDALMRLRVSPTSQTGEG